MAWLFAYDGPAGIGRQMQTKSRPAQTNWAAFRPNLGEHFIVMQLYSTLHLGISVDFDSWFWYSFKLFSVLYIIYIYYIYTVLKNI